MANAQLPDRNWVMGTYILSTQNSGIPFNQHGKRGDYIFDFKEEADACLEYLKASSDHNSKCEDGLDLVVREL